MTTTPRDAIAGLSDRLRHLVSLNRTENGGPYQGYAAAECVSAMSEAATQIDALSARVKELEEECKRWAEVSIEQDYAKKDLRDRATRAEQERDEALERRRAQSEDARKKGE